MQPQCYRRRTVRAYHWQFQIRHLLLATFFLGALLAPIHYLGVHGYTIVIVILLLLALFLVLTLFALLTVANVVALSSVWGWRLWQAYRTSGKAIDSDTVDQNRFEGKR